MSLLAFQRALAELATSPDLCARVARDPDAALAGHDLTPVERRRLASAAGQRGMRVNCSLYRYNRIETLTAVVPATIFLLGDQGRAVADEFWAEMGPNRNMRHEVDRFAGFVRRAVARGRLESPFLLEVMEFELQRYDVAVAPRARLSAEVAATAARWPDGPLALHPLLRVAAFAHDPEVLLGRLDRRSPLPYPDVPEGEFYLLLDCRGGEYRQRPFDPAWARVVREVAGGGAPAPGAVEPLVAAGVLVRTAPAPGEAGMPAVEAVAV